MNESEVQAMARALFNDDMGNSTEAVRRFIRALKAIATTESKNALRDIREALDG